MLLAGCTAHPTEPTGAATDPATTSVPTGATSPPIDSPTATATTADTGSLSTADCFADGDGDGLGAGPGVPCGPDAVDNSHDCDDHDPAVGAFDDCDDYGGDGTDNPDDCEPFDPLVHPGAEPLAFRDYDCTPQPLLPIGEVATVQLLPVAPTGQLGRHSDVGDLDGDGRIDLVLASADGPARVDVFFGSDLPPSAALPAPAPSVTITIDPLTIGPGEPQVAVGGDIDGDGLGEMMVTAIHAQQLGIWPSSTLIRGELAFAQAPVLWNVEMDARLGTPLTLGDVDGDGVGEVALGQREPEGRVVVWSGATLGTAPTPMATWRSVHELEGEAAGDVDGDGLADLLVRRAVDDLDEAALFLIPGHSLALGHDGDIDAMVPTLVGPQASAFGAQATGVGDVDGDGLDDLVVSQELYSADGGVDNGRVLLFVASQLGGPLTDDDAYAHWTGTDGFHARPSESVGDLDGDGRVDLLVAGRPALDTWGLWMVPGSTVVPGAHELPGATRGVDLGAVGGKAHAGDIDGDGRSDLLFALGPASYVVANPWRAR